jgi:heat shock protein HslJ
MRIFLSFACLVLAGIAASCISGPAKTTGFDEVRGKEWELAEVISGSGVIVIDRQKLEAEGITGVYTLLIDEGRISGKAFPNRYLAPYELGDGQEISFGAVAGTLMANINNSGELQEETYYRFLDDVYRWNLSGGRLELHTKGPGGTDVRLIYREK